MKRIVAVSWVVAMVVMVSFAAAVVLQEDPDRNIYEETVLEFVVDVSIANQGNAPAYDIPLRLALPMDNDPVQEIREILITPAPERNSTDTWGNSFVHFTVPVLEPQEFWNVTLDVSLLARSIDYNVNDDDVGRYDGSQDRFLVGDSYSILTDPATIELARDIAGESDRIMDIAWNTYEWIVENIYYQQVPGEWDSATTLKNGEGGSAEMSNLFVALMRANGIPARRVNGWGNHFEQGEELQLTRFAHGWAEFHVPGQGWIPADPAWGKSQKFDNFARMDADHVALTLVAGIHFMWRGPYSSPYGETSVDTDYKITVQNVDVENKSAVRDGITAVIFILPVLFTVFLVVKRLRKRHV